VIIEIESARIKEDMKLRQLAFAAILILWPETLKYVWLFALTVMIPGSLLIYLKNAGFSLR
jgi:hypothetical protein